jgi:hypothetical protein
MLARRDVAVDVSPTPSFSRYHDLPVRSRRRTIAALRAKDSAAAMFAIYDGDTARYARAQL